MPQSKIDTPHSVEDVARASAAIQITDDEIATAQRRIAVLREHSAPLHAQIEELRAQQPLQVGPCPDQVEALLADPASRPDMTAIAGTVSSARKQDDVRRLTIATIEEAVSRINGDITAIEGEIAALQTRRAEEWREFATVAREYLMAQFKARFLDLRDNVMMPLNALLDLQGSNNERIAGIQAPRFGRETAVVIEWYEMHASPISGERRATHCSDRLYPPREQGARPPSETIASFRRALPEVPPEQEAPQKS